jgi:hypothetical protein
MLSFNKPFKLYYFKHKNVVDWSLRVSDNYVKTFRFRPEDFSYLMSAWHKKGGCQITTQNNVSMWVEHKQHTPRPEQSPASYIKISTHDEHFRYTYEDMLALERDYFYQTNNKMYWDE